MAINFLHTSYSEATHNISPAKTRWEIITLMLPQFTNLTDFPGRFLSLTHLQILTRLLVFCSPIWPCWPGQRRSEGPPDCQLWRRGVPPPSHTGFRPQSRTCRPPQPRSACNKSQVISRNLLLLVWVWERVFLKTLGPGSGEKRKVIKRLFSQAETSV